MIEARARRLFIDGRPAIVISGEVHYFRIARPAWGERLDLAREVGCSAIASYIPWLFHELPGGTIDVSGSTRPERDVGEFIDLCAERGLYFIARPGPFVMAELRNEGIPQRVYGEHPEIVGTSWDGRPIPTAAVDYLAPAFLAEVRRWYAAILPILASRLEPNGGNVIAIQLDNEIGMLTWIANAPNLTDGFLADLRTWCREQHPDVRSRYPIDLEDDHAWRRAVASPAESWAGALRVDLAGFMRNRFARYVQELAKMAAEHGIAGIPLLINIHGTEGGGGVSFGIGVSQLMASYAGVPGMVAGSDHYLGDLTPVTLTDLHFINSIMAAANGPDQPLGSLEFEVGSGDYGGGHERLDDPSAVDLKARLCLAQGNRLLNFYLLAGGINPRLDEPGGGGTDRIAITGERHGVGAPIGPEGQRGLSFPALRCTCTTIAGAEQWLADHDEEHDDLAVAFLPDAFATEVHHPASATMRDVVTDLAAHRGAGGRRALWHALLLAGYRFGAVDLQDPRATLPSLLCLGSGVYLAEPVQRRLVEFVQAGGRLLQLGPLAERDLEGGPCALLGEALGVAPGRIIRERPTTYPSVRSTARGPALPETRVGWLQELLVHRAIGQQAPRPEPLLTDGDGRVCAVEARLGAGRAVLLAAGLPAIPDYFAALATRLGVAPGLRLTTTVTGVIALTTRSPQGDRLLHLLNPTGFAALVELVLDGEVLAPTGWLVPPRSGHMLPLGLPTAWGRIERATSEVVDLDVGSVTFAPSLDPFGHRVVLRTSAGIEVSSRRGADIGRDGDLVTVRSTAAHDPLTIRITARPA